MEPLLYRAALHFISKRDSLPASSLHPVQIAELLAIEEHLGAPLPSQYAEWLLTVGVGYEHGGLALWHHCDLARPGSVVETSNNEGPNHREMCIFFDSLEGDFFGFLKSPKGWQKEIYIVDEAGSYEKYCSDFAAFLRSNIDCSEEELAHIKEEQMVAV